jgi:hypothetical protein
VQIEDPILYDLVINIETMSVLVACAFVAATVKQTDFAITEDAVQRLADFHLASLVKVALASAPETGSLELAVDARRGVVEISGRAPMLSDGTTGDHLTGIAGAVPGVRETRLRVEWFDPYP